MSAATPDCCFPNAADMLSVEDAIASLLQHAKPITETDQVDLIDAANRVLATDITSTIDVPGFDNSAMDGYAFSSSDMERAQAEGLEITQRIPAGTTGTPLQPGSAARIFTGAPVPEGVDTVAMQEICRIENNRMVLEKPVAAGANIRPRGNDIGTGDTILESGSVLRAAQLGLAASVGVGSVDVYRTLKIAIFSTGDELVQPGTPLAAGQIYNSNRYQMHGLLQAQGCEVIDLGTVPDTFEATRQALLAGQEQADMVLTSGGVSVGEEDHVKAALESVGELSLWRIRMKPGKPLAFGKIGATPFIGLPGNPVSAFVTFLLFARPYLQLMQGRTTAEPLSYPVQAGFSYHAKHRREYVRVRLRQDAETLIAESFARQGSDVMRSVAWSDGLVEVAEDSNIEPGDTVRFLPFSEWAR
jgi:molybdopterin molybdotransferase